MKRCLLVEASSIIRKVARRILQSEGYEVLDAATGSQGLSLCASHSFDIIIVDACLPDLEASDFIRHVRAMPLGNEPRIMICLIEADLGAIMRAKRAGGQGYMQKPFIRAQLLARIEALAAAPLTRSTAAAA